MYGGKSRYFNNWFGCICQKVNGIFCPFKAWVSKEELEDGVFKFILHRTVGTHNHPSNVAKIIANTMKVGVGKGQV